MTQLILKAAAGGAIFAVLAVLVSWAVFYESSPIYQGPYNQGVLAKIWMILNLPAFMAGFAVGGHSGSMPAAVITMCLQWFMIGFGVVYIVSFRRAKTRVSPTATNL